MEEVSSDGGQFRIRVSVGSRSVSDGGLNRIEVRSIPDKECNFEWKSNRMEERQVSDESISDGGQHQMEEASISQRRGEFSNGGQLHLEQTNPRYDPVYILQHKILQHSKSL